MEKIEFYVDPEGSLFYKFDSKTARRLTKFDIDITVLVLSTVMESFPKAYKKLCELYNNGEQFSLCRKDNPSKAFNAASRFIRCNFGEYNNLTGDIENGIMYFEEVHCPLRGGLCDYEHVICKPRNIVQFSPAEQQVAKLYLQGYTFDKIAAQLDKQKNTVKTILFRIKNKLNVKSCRDIIKAAKDHHIIF